MVLVWLLFWHRLVSVTSVRVSDSQEHILLFYNRYNKTIWQSVFILQENYTFQSQYANSIYVPTLDFCQVRIRKVLKQIFIATGAEYYLTLWWKKSKLMVHSLKSTAFNLWFSEIINCLIFSDKIHIDSHLPSYP